MKKFVTGAIVALLMSAGLVASASTTAHAGPYPGQVATETQIKAPNKVVRKQRANICVTVTVKSGTGTPVGTVTITVERNAGKFRQSASFPYSGGQVCLTTKKLRRVGGYNIKAEFSARAGTVFDDSSDVDGFDVVKPRRR